MVHSRVECVGLRLISSKRTLFVLGRQAIGGTLQKPQAEVGRVKRGDCTGTLLEMLWVAAMAPLWAPEMPVLMPATMDFAPVVECTS